MLKFKIAFGRESASLSLNDDARRPVASRNAFRNRLVLEQGCEESGYKSVSGAVSVDQRGDLAHRERLDHALRIRNARALGALRFY